MHTRRAGRVVARPLNCGVRRRVELGALVDERLISSVAPASRRWRVVIGVIASVAGRDSMAIVANRYWILLALVTGAVVCYAVGSMAGFGLFLVGGGVLELAFWHELIKRKRRR